MLRGYFKKVFLYSLFIFSLSFIYSCSDGGSSLGQSSGEAGELTVSGTVTLSRNLNTQSLPENTTVLIEAVSLGNNGNQIDKKVVLAKNGFFSVSLKPSLEGGKIVITASATGYSSGTKTIKYQTPSEISNTNIAVPITPVKESVVSLSDISIQSTTNKTVRVAFFKDKEGKLYTLSGERIQTASQNDTLIMELSIPLSKLQQATENIKISYRDFRPSDPNDFQNFPGEETTDGNELVSVGFDWLEITDPNTGENPFENTVSTQLARDELGEYYRLLRYVDCEQINKIRQSIPLDEEPNKEGVQLTFYAFDFDKGIWVPAGKATFVSSPNVSYYEIGEDENIVDTAWDYIIQNGCVNDTPCDPNNPTSTACVDVNGDGEYEDVSCEGNSVFIDENDICSSNNTAYVVVSVTNPQLNWKNLDYIKPALDEVGCDISIKDSNGNPVSTYVYMYPDNNNCIENVYGTTSGDGNVHLTTLKYCDPPNGIVEYYNPIEGKYEQYDNGNPVELGQSCQIDITITNNNKCTVTGYVKNQQDNSPRVNEYVYIFDDNYTVYRWGYTDQEGKFSISIPCGIKLNLRTEGMGINPSQSKTFNVNGSIDENSEEEDINNTVKIYDILLPNLPPEGYGWLSSSIVKSGNTINVSFYSWDVEGDLPISYELKIKDGQNNIIESFTGSINTNYAFENVSIDVNSNTYQSGTYYVSVVLTDQKNNSKEIDIGFFSVYEGNTPPVISYFYSVPTYVPEVGMSVTLYGSGYDLDGDSLNSEGNYECYDNASTVIETGTFDGQSLLNNGYLEFTIPSNSDITYCDLTWTLTDGIDETSRNIKIEIRNEPPVVSIWADSQLLPEGTKEVTIHSYVYDPEGDNYSCVWKENGNVISESCDSVTLADLDARYGIPAEIKVSLDVTDEKGNSSSAEIVIKIGTLSDINVNIQ